MHLLLISAWVIEKKKEKSPKSEVRNILFISISNKSVSRKRVLGPHVRGREHTITPHFTSWKHAQLKCSVSRKSPQLGSFFLLYSTSLLSACPPWPSAFTSIKEHFLSAFPRALSYFRKCLPNLPALYSCPTLSMLLEVRCSKIYTGFCVCSWGHSQQTVPYSYG